MYRNSEIDLENLQEFLKTTVERVKSQEDPDVLNSVKKVYKKTVPFSMRLYVAALLAKEAQKSFRGHYRSNKKDFYENKSKVKAERSSYRERKVPTESSAEEKQPRVRVQIDPSVASTIFISIGRNRHVFPRDLVGMLISVSGLERDRIGDIKVLANYSFVQLFKEDAEKAIATLNGYDYRGRKLSVSYSRLKDEEAETVTGPVSQEIQNQSDEDAAAYAAAERAASANEPFSAPHLSQDAE